MKSAIAPSAAECSDAELVERSRRSDRDAFAELWRRHAGAARAAASSVTTSVDPDELVATAFAHVHQTLRDGQKLTGAFRPYLYSMIKNAADTRAATAEMAIHDPSDLGLGVLAFRTLPTQWQEVLWYTEVETMQLHDIGPLLGMNETTTAALATHAQDGLREAWLQAHIARVPEGSDHAITRSRLSAYAGGTLGARATSRVETHLDACTECATVATEAKIARARMTSGLLPKVLGTAGALGYSAWIHAGGTPAAAAAMPASAFAAAGATGAASTAPSGGVSTASTLTLGSVAVGLVGAGVVAIIATTAFLTPAPEASVAQVLSGGRTTITDAVREPSSELPLTAATPVDSEDQDSESEEVPDLELSPRADEDHQSTPGSETGSRPQDDPRVDSPPAPVPTPVPTPIATPTPTPAAGQPLAVLAAPAVVDDGTGPLSVRGTGAAPYAAIEVVTHDQVVARTAADQAGDWAVTVIRPAPGTHEFAVRQIRPEGTGESPLSQATVVEILATPVLAGVVEGEDIVVGSTRELIVSGAPGRFVGLFINGVVIALILLDEDGSGSATADFGVVGTQVMTAAYLSGEHFGLSATATVTVVDAAEPASP